MAAPIDYREWSPSAALAGAVLAYWRVAGDGRSVPSPTILPDAYVEIVINLGGPVTLVGLPNHGSQPPRAVVGLLDRAIEMQYPPDVCMFGIRLHPARACTILGVAARAVVNLVSPLARVCKALDGRLAAAVNADPRLESEDARDSIERVLVDHLGGALPNDVLIVRAVDRLLGAEVPLTVSALAAEFQVSPRHLHRRFLDEVGVSPKRLERLARFARTWRRAIMGPPLTWADLALANGYADQSHLVREFRTFGARPPAHLFTVGWYDAINVIRQDASHHVRSVQDRLGRSGHDERRRK
jgi:AraC-like DNA-binding protein